MSIIHNLNAHLNYRWLNKERNKITLKKLQKKQIRQARKHRARQIRQERRSKIKMARLRKRLRRKERRQMKKERKARQQRRKKKLEPCHQYNDKLQCFSHDNNHWKTEPFWSGKKIWPFIATDNNSKYPHIQILLKLICSTY